MSIPEKPPLIPDIAIDAEAARRFGAISFRQLPGPDLDVMAQFAREAPNLTHAQQDQVIEVIAQSQEEEEAVQARQLLFWALYPHAFFAARVRLRNHHYDTRIDLDDLAQAGALTLLDSIDGYAAKASSERKSLVNYVRSGVKHALSGEVGRRLLLFSDPEKKAQLSDFRETFSRLKAELGRSPATSELAAATGATLEEAEAIGRLIHGAILLEPSELAAMDTQPETAPLRLESKPSERAARKVNMYLEFLIPLHARAIRLFFGMEEYGALSVAERAKILQTHETYVSTVTRQALERLSEVAKTFEVGTLDYKVLWTKHKIRNLFSIFHRMGVAWDGDKGVDALKQEAETLLNHITRSRVEQEAMTLLYGLRGKNSQISTNEAANQLGKSQTGISAMERRLLKAMDVFREAAVPTAEGNQIV